MPSISTTNAKPEIYLKSQLGQSCQQTRVSGQAVDENWKTTTPDPNGTAEVADNDVGAQR